MKPLNLDNNTKLELSAPIDPSLLKTRTMGKEELTYVSQNTVVDLLNKAFNYMWSFVIDEQWMEQGVPVVKKENAKWPFNEKNTDMSQVQIDAEGKRYVVLEQGPVVWTRGRLKVPFQQEDGSLVWIEKSACGAQAMIGNQAVQSTNAYKGSMSDCLKKCASLFGIALELYRSTKEEEEHFQAIRDMYMPDTWTEEVKAQYAKPYAALLKLLESYGWSFDDIDYYVLIATKNVYNKFEKMPPEYLDALIKAIKEDA